MKRIDLDSWPRRGHYELFRTFDQPHYAVTVDLRCDGIRERARAVGAPLNLLVAHAITAAASAVPALRQRLRADGVVEHEVLHPSVTVMGPGDVFAFCPLTFHAELDVFVRASADAVARARSAPGVDVDHEADDRLFISAVPWFAFTGVTHPVRSRTLDSVPLVAWGRITASAGEERMPVNVQVHHALVDGVHLANFFARLEALLAG